MTDGKNVPFSLNDEEDDSDVFSSVEVQRQNSSRPEQAPAMSGPVLSSAPIPAAKQAPAGPPVAAPVAAAPQPSVRTSGPMDAVRASARNSGALQAPAAAAPSTTRKSGALPAPVVSGPSTTPRPRLVVETAGQPGGRSVDVDKDYFSIGRESSDLPLADEYVCGFHALIRLEGEAVVLQDISRLNGVYLRIADDLALEDWDEIAVGTQRFVFRTSWDVPAQRANPNKKTPKTLGGNAPKEGARLVQMYSGDQVGAVSRLFDRLTIGRQKADVVEPDDAWLSTPHAVIERRDGKFFIQDANSQHGTFIRVLDSVELIDGDVFMVGRTRIKITYP